MFYLKNCKKSVKNAIKIWGWRFPRKVERSSEELHAEEGEDEDEEEEEEEERHDRRKRVHQSYHKIAQRGPVSEND